ncbi:hypothetical protein N8Z24_00550 [bacterium]|nr:hypothetical protein [bacterium]
MISLLISLLIVGLIIAIDYHFLLVEDKLYYRGRQLYKKSIGPLSTITIVVFVLIYPVVHSAYNRVEVKEKVSEEELIALSDNQGIHGSFGGSFLIMSGSIDSSMDYNFYVKAEAGGYILKTAPALQSRVIEKAEGPYTITYYEYYLERKPNEYFFGTKSCSRKGKEEWVFVIPPNSIKKQFKLDME